MPGVELDDAAAHLRVIVDRHDQQTPGVLGVALDDRPLDGKVGGLLKEEGPRQVGSGQVESWLRVE